MTLVISSSTTILGKRQVVYYSSGRRPISNRIATALTTKTVQLAAMSVGGPALLEKEMG